MLKTVGIVLIAMAAGSAGFLYRAGVRRRLHALEISLEAVALLRTAVVLLLQPLPEAIRSHAAQNKLLDVLSKQEAAAQPDLQRQAMRAIGLKQEESSVLEGLLAQIPALSMGQEAPFAAAQESITRRLDKQRALVQREGVLYPKLGLLAAFALVLLLI